MTIITITIITKTTTRAPGPLPKLRRQDFRPRKTYHDILSPAEVAKSLGLVLDCAASRNLAGRDMISRFRWTRPGLAGYIFAAFSNLADRDRIFRARRADLSPAGFFRSAQEAAWHEQANQEGFSPRDPSMLAQLPRLECRAGRAGQEFCRVCFAALRNKNPIMTCRRPPSRPGARPDLFGMPAKNRLCDRISAREKGSYQIPGAKSYHTKP